MKNVTLTLGSKDDIVEGILTTIEEEVGSKIFTVHVFDRESEESLDLLVVFEDKSIAEFRIEFLSEDGQLATRVKGNFLQ